MKKQHIHLETIESPLVPIGTIMGQKLFIEVRGHDAEERERNFVAAKIMLSKAFDMPDEYLADINDIQPPESTGGD